MSTANCPPGAKRRSGLRPFPRFRFLAFRFSFFNLRKPLKRTQRDRKGHKRTYEKNLRTHPFPLSCRAKAQRRRVRFPPL